MWHYSETGSGRPLILLHGIGMSHAAWNPVIPYLSSTRRIIAFDIAGFGSTPPLPEGTLPTVANLVDGLARSIRGPGIALPVDMAGNSLGGTMALDAARGGIARSVVAISPPGLWSGHGAPHVKYVFKTLRFTTRNFPALVKTMMRNPVLREVMLAVPVSVGSRQMPASDAIRAVEDIRRSPTFEQTFEHTLAPFDGHDIGVPVTVAFGNRDWIVTKAHRRRDVLPAHAKWVEKRGWGHVPMWVDPTGVAQLILDGAEQGTASAAGWPGVTPQSSRRVPATEITEITQN